MFEDAYEVNTVKDKETFWADSVYFCNLIWTAKFQRYESELIIEYIEASKLCFGC